MPIASRLALLLIAAMPWAAQANTVCCEANGKTYCDDGMPAACHGKAYRELNRRGIVIREVAAPLTAEQRAKRDAERAKQRAEEERLAEQDRLNRKLVSTYPTLSDLDIGHERQLADLKKGQQLMEQKLAEAEKKKHQLANEAEFYQKGGMPASLKSQVEGNERDIENQRQAIATRVKDIEVARQRFEEEKQRYLTLTANNAERLR
jgi:hypothetical protein